MLSPFTFQSFSPFVVTFAVYYYLWMKLMLFSENEVRSVSVPFIMKYSMISIAFSALQEQISEDLRATLNAFLYRTGEQSNK